MYIDSQQRDMGDTLSSLARLRSQCLILLVRITCECPVVKGSHSQRVSPGATGVPLPPPSLQERHPRIPPLHLFRPVLMLIFFPEKLPS